MTSSRILFFMFGAGYLRFYDDVIEGLLERGHEVDLLSERPFATADEQAWLERLRSRPAFNVSTTDVLRQDRWWTFGRALRRTTDYLHFASARFSDRPALVARSERRAPPGVVRVLATPLLRSLSVRKALMWLLSALERAIPTSPEVEAELRRHSPDVLVIAPNMNPGSRHSEYVKAARKLRIPTCLCVASWDNLSTKQQIREMPDSLVVWNEVQRREAVELHDADPEIVRITGAYPFDRWFTWQPRPREEFCARVGIDARRPYLLYVGGSLFPAELTEAQWVRDEWLPSLREDERFAGVSIVVRGHPERCAEWDAVDLGKGVALFPQGLAQPPVSDAARADYFDSIYHSAAVIGLNTSAMIEAAIIGRPVYTVLAPESANSQTGTFHFDYLLEVGGGLLVVAWNLPEHREQLAASLAGEDTAAGSRAAFLEAFVRPHGLDRPALPFLLDAIEKTALAVPRPAAADGLGTIAVRGALRAVLGVRRAARRLA